MSAEANEHEQYVAAVDYLYSFINFEQKRLERYHASKLDTSRMSRLLDVLNNPHKLFPAIHIAGTKGKGSVAIMCASVLRQAGLRVGLYTSPHLREFRERVRVLTKKDEAGWITQADFVTLITELKPHLEQFEDVTWFEIVTAVAFLHFARQQVDVAVVEVGLGGRLDTTNVLTPLVSVITSLSLDHTALLGDTLPEIAYEKGGIIKPGIPVVTSPQPEPAMARLQQIAQERSSPITVVGQEWQFNGRKTDQPATGQILTITHSPDVTFIPPQAKLQLALVGEHQQENAVVALAALHIVQPHFPTLNLTAVREGLATVQWPGRLQTVHQSALEPTFLIDAAHNKDSAAKLAKALQDDYTYEKLWLIFGAPADKAINDMLTLLLPLTAGIIVAQADHPRAAAPDYLAQQVADLGYAAIIATDLDDALHHAFALANANDLICATGSIIFIGDLLNHWYNLQIQPVS